MVAEIGGSKQGTVGVQRFLGKNIVLIRTKRYNFYLLK
jgi:hypothetical protein